MTIKIEFIKILMLFLIMYIIINYKKDKIILTEIKQDIDNIKEYYILNNKGILINKKSFNKIQNPKVSVVTAVYNRQEFILRFIRSIQNQFFDDIEIIFVDDCSTDLSPKLIEEYQKEDERIILLKQKKNKGTLISRNIGVLKAKGEYVILPDPDDILSQNILNICYNEAIKNNYEMIRFNLYSDFYFPFNTIANNLKNIIYQPELSTYLIYGYGYKNIIDGIISNKFIKTKTYLLTLKEINNFYLNQNMSYFEDGLINFALHRNSKSLYLLKKIGYYYIFNKDSVSRNINIESYLKCFMIFIKYIFENTKNNKYEKDIVFYLLTHYIKDFKIFNNLKNNLKYLQISENIINEIYNNKYITVRTQNYLRHIKYIINNLKKNQNKFKINIWL